MRFLFLLFIIVPIAEMWILIEVGRWLGALPTILLVMLTAVIGITLLRKQGVSTLLRAQQRMQQGEMPAAEMIEGIVLAVGGALLLTPGFVTDGFGFACLIPWSRRKLAAFAVAHFAQIGVNVVSTSFSPPDDFDSSRFQHQHRKSGADTSTTIDGEYKVEK